MQDLARNNGDRCPVNANVLSTSGPQHKGNREPCLSAFGATTRVVERQALLAHNPVPTACPLFERGPPDTGT